MDTLTLQDGYSRLKVRPTKTFRPMTSNEVREGVGSGTIYFTGDFKTFRHCRANGAVKTWKTRPDVELPIKYGMHEFARAVSRDGRMVLPSGGILLVPVDSDGLQVPERLIKLAQENS